MNSDDTRTAVRDVLAAHAQLPVDISTLADDDDLFTAGMTSFSSVNAMLALEDRFDVEFPDSMLNRDQFESVNAIAAAIEQIATLA